MWYKCLECGHIFEEGEKARWEEDRGEFWGTPCSETVDGCPVCKGDYEEIHKCKICDENWGNPDEYYGNDICDECIENCFNYESALVYLKDSDLLIDFFFYYFGEKTSISENVDLQAEIEQWYLRQTTPDKIMKGKKFYTVLKEFIFDDKGCWADFIVDYKQKEAKNDRARI